MDGNGKKIIAINASRRKQNTYGMLKSILDDLQNNGYEVEMIHLSDYEIKECIGCEGCIRGRECPCKDDVRIIMDRLVQSDGIILGTPVYMGNVTGRFKTFIDRTCVWFHRPELTGKPVLLAATTAGSALKFTLKYMENMAISWGLQPTDKIGLKVGQKVKGIMYKEFIRHLNKNKEDFKPSMNQLINFQVQKILALKILTLDKEYWQNKGWSEKSYYFECRIGITKKIITKLFYNFLYNKVKKTGTN